MTAPDPRVGEIEARLAAVPAKGESQFVGLALPVAATTELWNLRQLAMADVAYLLAELRKAHEALEQVEALHKPVKIYDECDCPDGTHPDEYDYIDCEDYVGCENSLSGVGCQECCVDSWDSLTQECGENHSHSKDPAFRCDTIKALRAAVAAANGDGRD